jgi:hypothetical protein
MKHSGKWTSDLMKSGFRLWKHIRAHQYCMTLLARGIRNRRRRIACIDVVSPSCSSDCHAPSAMRAVIGYGKGVGTAGCIFATVQIRRSELQCVGPAHFLACLLPPPSQITTNSGDGFDFLESPLPPPLDVAFLRRGGVNLYAPPDFDRSALEYVRGISSASRLGRGCARRHG